MTDYYDAAKSIAMELWKAGYDLADIQLIGEHIAFMADDNFWSKVIRGEDVHISDIKEANIDTKPKPTARD